MEYIYPYLKRISFVLILIMLFLTIGIEESISIESDLESSKLIKLQEKVVKGYSNKFCNAIGIGISIEGATSLTINENIKSRFNPSLWLEIATSGDKNLNSINTQDLSESISKDIASKCGRAIGISSQEDILKFNDYFKSIQDELLKSQASS